VLFVGRFAPNKGLFTLLDAVSVLQKTGCVVRLGLLGRGPLEEALKQRIGHLALHNVTILPRLDSAEDVARLYNQTRMLVCASTSEGGPRVTVEAMACGIPVISTPVGVMSDLVEDGVNGLLFHWNARELAGKIRLLLDDESLARRLGEAGRQSVQRYSAEQVIEQYARGYQTLPAGKGNA
jgi:glycosyltransferase involved in cell wall biosynthesis